MRNLLNIVENDSSLDSKIKQYTNAAVQYILDNNGDSITRDKFVSDLKEFIKDNQGIETVLGGVTINELGRRIVPILKDKIILAYDANAVESIKDKVEMAKNAWSLVFKSLDQKYDNKNPIDFINAEYSNYGLGRNYMDWVNVAAKMILDHGLYHMPFDKDIRNSYIARAKFDELKKLNSFDMLVNNKLHS